MHEVSLAEVIRQKTKLFHCRKQTQIASRGVIVSLVATSCQYEIHMVITKTLFGSQTSAYPNKVADK